MKRSLILSALTLLLCVLLAGCSSGYSSTPMEAYFEAYSRGDFRNDSPIDTELDCISLTDSEAIWFAGVRDESANDCIIHVRMNVKDDKFRFDAAPTISYISDLENLQDRPMLKDLSYYGCISDTGRVLYYSFVLTELLPEIDEEHDYTLEHYIVPMKNGEETDLTLVYYFEEMG